MIPQYLSLSSPSLFGLFLKQPELIFSPNPPSSNTHAGVLISRHTIGVQNIRSSKNVKKHQFNLGVQKIQNLGGGGMKKGLTNFHSNKFCYLNFNKKTSR
jgi:hypothetical protein